MDGQVHDRKDSDFIKEKLRSGNLDKHMLVSVDCTNMNPDVQHDFFTPARDRTVDGKIKKLVTEELIRHLALEDFSAPHRATRVECSPSAGAS